LHGDDLFQPKYILNMTIYILRHGETDFNVRGIVQGRGVDTSLNERGQNQALAFFERYQSLPFEAVLTSTLQRTHQTVQKFIDLGLPWEQHADIDEMSWGTHEGQESNPTLREEYNEMLRQWSEGNYDYSIGGGESLNELAERSRRFVEHLKTRDESLILVCSHGRAMRSLMAALKNVQLREMEQYHHSNTGLYLVNFDGQKFEIELTNDLSHISGEALAH
jgi:phosphoserine phosphatase